MIKIVIIEIIVKSDKNVIIEISVVSDNITLKMNFYYQMRESASWIIYGINPSLSELLHTEDVEKV